MRQRNTSGQQVDIPSLGLSMKPGDVEDIKGHVPGLTPVKATEGKAASRKRAKPAAKAPEIDADQEGFIAGMQSTDKTTTETAEQQEDPK